MSVLKKIKKMISKCDGSVFVKSVGDVAELVRSLIGTTKKSDSTKNSSVRSVFTGCGKNGTLQIRCK
ncbi:MAG: hypothetical protein HQK88_03585 [Nitrospirae bacterium]|nr:hypothetical protein [Nitrospirota bacterium]MBF0534202.1 hypothetical protein [Nitrospirota bacterium]MBF0615884.1 hypothetical protein [Nitrospirota bacterium]